MCAAAGSEVTLGSGGLSHGYQLCPASSAKQFIEYTGIKGPGHDHFCPANDAASIVHAYVSGKVLRIDGGWREEFGSTSARTFPGVLEVSDGF